MSSADDSAPPARSAVAPAPSGAALLASGSVALALVVAVVGKLWRMRVISPEVLAGVGVGDLVAADLLFYGLLLAAVVFLAAHRRALASLSALVGCVVLAVQGMGTRYLLEVGEQASWADVADAVARWRDLRMVLADSAAPLVWLLVLVASSAVALFFLLRGTLARGRRTGAALRSPGAPRARRQARGGLLRSARGLTISAGLAAAALGSLLSLRSAPSSVAALELARNGPWLLARTYTARGFAGTLSSWPQRWADEDSVQALRRREAKPNLLLVVLESTGYAATSLARTQAGAHTPALAELASQGVSARRMRALLPHTSKSLFSMLCGRAPAMQVEQVEATPLGNLDCLADVLGRAGYRSAFAQSAFGVFEQRPRLVHHFGFDEFVAWEDLRGERLSYFSSDDLSLATWFAEWLRSASVDSASSSAVAHHVNHGVANAENRASAAEPFFVTVLTSAPHHAYELPRSLRQRLSAEQRHRILLERQDEMLRRLLRELDARGLRENTLVLVVGDHGEGFGAHGIEQHDNNYFDESLRVPFVLAGPGVPAGQAVDSNAWLVDLLPTLAGLLGIGSAPGTGLEGVDLLAPDAGVKRQGPLHFSCHQPQRCSGFVIGESKYVRRPRDDLEFALLVHRAGPDDLLQEREPLPLAAAVAEQPDLSRHIAAHDRWIRAARWPVHRRLVFVEETLFGSWHCSDAGICRHPAAQRAADRVAEAGAAH